ncbi:bifunctional NAD(P)H-hydrate repair enzyme [Luteimonas padinae]|uniref:Bifunctional NAD(P)H-hydrate repair enzyme n=1 Tax=Luteimonas padinae TaxID=1714359 RepID=A0ABV6SYC5_9GAMM|nr:NAD(P)H-hydrate dehydratase [Luteimonas padinae]GHD65499.1 bifunctional NAD(P)H-hydrate repair enzyme [Luteimonas padinae]
MHAPRADAMTPLYDIAGVRRAEAQAVALLGGDGFELMRRAGAAGWRALLEHWPQARRIVVACGPGNNGGDGYVLALHALQAGREVRALHADGHPPRSALARRACAAFVDAGGVAAAADAALPECDLVVDAMFGIGFDGRADDATSAMLAALAGCGADVLALDVPSGVDASNGSVPGIAVRATRTLQFIADHAGLATGAALDHVGALAMAPLGLPEGSFEGIAPAAWRVRAAALAALLPRRKRTAHKGAAGHVLVAGGNHGMGGAALLAAEAALRAGAGLVSVATRAAHVAPLLARTPEAMAHAIEDPEDVVRMSAPADVCAIGPGLGRDAWAAGLLGAVINRAHALVVDADALNLLAASPRGLRTDSVLTPHPGEAARLLGRSTAEVQRDRLAAAHALCLRFGCVVVLKGAGSVVAAPDGRAWIIDAGNPGMAVGGMGDALTGIIAALRAQGLPAAEAAVAGALQHAVAGDRAAETGGARGLLPSDLIAALRHPDDAP